MVHRQKNAIVAYLNLNFENQSGHLFYVTSTGAAQRAWWRSEPNRPVNEKYVSGTPSEKNTF